MQKTTLISLGIKISKKQKFAQDYFKKKWAKVTEEKQNILNEVLEQIEVCEGLFKPVTETQIEEWIDCDDVNIISRKARQHKFS